LPGDTTLARLLAAERGSRNHLDLPRLSLKQILLWADAHYRRTGRWPKCSSGPILCSGGETWSRVDSALKQGNRGLSAGQSLSHVLAEHRGARLRARCPEFTIKQILAWADAHHARTGRWPTWRTGTIPEAQGESWRKVNRAFRDGSRGLAGGSTLYQFLCQHRPIDRDNRPPPLSTDEILVWADAYFQHNGTWPICSSGPIEETPQENWRNIDKSLRLGRRGLAAGGSLGELLAQYGRIANG
jgi:hypothetical protein